MEAAELDFPGASLDAASMLGSNLGIGGTLAASERMFAQLACIIRPGGLLIGEGRDSLATQNPEHLTYHAANRAAGRAPGQVRVRIDYDRAVGEWFSLLLFEPDRLQALLERTGWVVEEWQSTPDSPAYALIA